MCVEKLKRFVIWNRGSNVACSSELKITSNETRFSVEIAAGDRGHACVRVVGENWQRQS
jgi:hypothetical protein